MGSMTSRAVLSRALAVGIVLVCAWLLAVGTGPHHRSSTQTSDSDYSILSEVGAANRLSITQARLDSILTSAKSFANELADRGHTAQAIDPSATVVLSHRQLAVSVISPGDTVDSNQSVAVVVLTGDFPLAADAPPQAHLGTGQDVILTMDVVHGDVLDATVIRNADALPSLAILGDVVKLVLP